MEATAPSMIATMHRVGTWCKWLTGASPVWRAASLLSVNDIGSDREHGLCSNRSAIRRLVAKFVHESLDQFHRDLIDAIVVVSIGRVFALHFIIHSKSVIAADDFHPGVLDGRQRIGSDRQTRNSAGHRAVNLTIMQGEHQMLGRVLVVHVVNDVERLDVGLRKPVERAVKAGEQIIVVQVFPSEGFAWRATC